MIGISALSIIDKKGKSIISRIYRTNIPSNFLDIFNKKDLEHDPETQPPLVRHKDLVFFISHKKNIRIIAVTKGNANAMMIFSFLKSFQNLLEDFLVEIDAEKVRDNIITIYELLDEIIDNGYPQTTDFKVMKNYIISA